MRSYGRVLDNSGYWMKLLGPLLICLANKVKVEPECRRMIIFWELTYDVALKTSRTFRIFIALCIMIQYIERMGRFQRAGLDDRLNLLMGLRKYFRKYVKLLFYQILRKPQQNIVLCAMIMEWKSWTAEGTTLTWLICALSEHVYII